MDTTSSRPMITSLKGKHYRTVIVIFTVSVCIFSALYCFFAFLLLDHLFPMPLYNRPVSTVVTAADGTPLRAFSDDRGIWRYPASVNQVSPLYLEAVLTYEDRWFYWHPGINPLSIVRAIAQNIQAGRIISGGSTLTMQVVRILSGVKRRSYKRKAYQIFKALQLEWHLTKHEILTIYLTHAPFGSNIEGVQTASHTWLGKDVRELSHAEAALLAVLPQAPSFYRPDRHPDRARKARDKVLDRLGKQSVWSEQEIRAAKQEPVIALRFHPPVIAPLAARRLHFQDPANPLIHTTLDFDLQVHVQEIVKNYVSELIPFSSYAAISSQYDVKSSQYGTKSSLYDATSSQYGTKSSLSGAALVVNHKTLEVNAYIGSADFTSKAGKGHVDMILAIRSPGSTLKPFLYGAAMDEGLIHSHSLLLDTPRFKAAYEPGNFTGRFTGPVSVASALRNSLNVPAVQVLEVYGPQRFHDRLKHAGATLQFQGKPNLSIILGGAGINLESLVTLYTALVRGGLAGKPRLIKNDTISERYLISSGAAWIILQILSQPLPGYEGINKLAGHVPIAWKTGTSYGFRDAWAMGIMGDYVVGVWVGRPDGTPVPGQYGAVTAMPLLKRILEALPLSDFQRKKPESVKKTTICWPLGYALKVEQQPENCLKKHDAWIIDGKTPATMTEGYLKHSSLLKTFWVNSRGERAQPSCGGIEKISVAIWPESVEAWLPPQWRRKNRIPKASTECPDLAAFLDNKLQITSVGNGSILSRPPGQTTLPFIPLATIGGEGEMHWFLNSEPIAVMKNGKAGTLPMPLPGKYQLVAADESGNSDIIFFSVISQN